MEHFLHQSPEPSQSGRKKIISERHTVFPQHPSKEHSKEHPLEKDCAQEAGHTSDQINPLWEFQLITLICEPSRRLLKLSCFMSIRTLIGTF